MSPLDGEVMCRGIRYRDEDDAYESRRQREDDALLAKEYQDAYFEGREAGRLELASGLNRYAPGTALAAAWERGRSSVEAQRLADELQRRARKCLYSTHLCDCDGRGHCLDVA